MLQLLKIKMMPETANGQSFDIVQKCDGVSVRRDVATYALALEIAQRIEAKMIEEIKSGAGSMDVV